MSESLWKPHVTVAAVIESNDKFLLVEEEINGITVFNQPAGHLEPNESLLDAVVRESLEETRYRFVPEGLIGIYRFTPPESGEKTYLRFCFCGKASEQIDGILDDDILAVRWMSMAEIRAVEPQHRTPLVMKCILDYLHKPPCSLDIFDTDYA